MAVKPITEMDDETFRKHLEARHTSLHNNLARLESRGSKLRARAEVADTEALRGHRAIHQAEHRIHASGEVTGANWTEHEHRDD